MKDNIPEEQQAQEQTQFLAGLIEHISQPMIIASADKRLCLWNAAFSKLTGYTDEELRDPIISAGLTAPEWHDSETKALKELQRTGKSQTFQKEYIHKDGSRVPVEVLVYHLADAEGKLQYYIGLISDITERKRAEEALKQSEGKYRSILEDIKEGYWETDLAGNFTYFNDAICRLLGYSKKEMKGMNYRAYTGTEDVDKVYKAFNQVFRTGKPIRNMNYEIIRNDRGKRFAETSVFPRQNDRKEIIGFRGVSHDVTDRMRIEEVLRQSEEKYRTILERMEESYYEVDLAGSFTFFNDALCRQLGYSKEELMGINYKVYTPPEKTEEVFQAYNQVYRTGEPTKLFDMEHIKGDGTRIVIENSIFPLRNETGKIIGFRGVGRDVTERLQMDQALKRSEERYRTILDEIEDGFFEVDPAGNFTFVNNAFHRYLGYSPGELIGVNYKATTAAEDVEKVYRRFNQVHKTGMPIKNIDLKSIRKDGSTGSIEITVGPIRSKNGEIIGFRGVTHDMTERMQMEEALRRSEERYRTILEEMEESYFETDLAGNYTIFNDAICRQLGYSREELTGMNYKVYTSPEEIKRVFQVYNRIYRTGEPNKMFQAEQIRKDGERISVEYSVFPIRNESGEITGFRGVGRDITKRKEMEEALRRSEERYRTLLDEMEESYYEDDLDGNFTFVNDALCHALGYSREELIGMNYKVYTPPEKVKEIFQAYNQVYRTGESIKLFARESIHKDGRRIPVETSILPLKNERGEIIGFRGISRDITERKRAEEERKQLEQKAQLASRLASVGELASGVAHEINNPLTGVIGYAHLLLARKDIPKDMIRDVEVINEGAQRVSNIVKKLLAFARQTKPEQRYVNINELIHNTLELQAYALASNNIKVSLQLTRDLPMTIADPGQLQQVFLNLIMNAETEMKSTRNNGKLLIKTEHIDNIIRVSFKDNGPGINKENLESIFNPFFTTREVGQGTGLGLSVCHGIVTEHKGMIWAESEPGKGATFIIELPVVTEDRQLEMPEPVIIEEPKKVAKAKILVVDDEPVIRQLVSQVLTDEGHEVGTADNAADALKMVKNNRYRLILLDIKMPGMSGVELYKQFQKIAPSITKRIVFITGDVMGKRTMDFLDKAKAPCMMKPFDAKQLKTEIRRILARK